MIVRKQNLPSIRGHKVRAGWPLFNLKVISVKDSMVIAKLLEISPWTKVEIGDEVQVD